MLVFFMQVTLPVNDLEHHSIELEDYSITNFHNSGMCCEKNAANTIKLKGTPTTESSSLLFTQPFKDKFTVGCALNVIKSMI